MTVTDVDHECDDRCSWRVTAERLRTFGYDLADLRHDASASQKVSWGQQFGRLKHQAWVDGHTRLCTNRPHRTAPPDQTPPSTRVRTRSIRNVTSARLLARLEFLREYIGRSREWAEQKSDFRARVREILAIEGELHDREVPFERVSR